MDGRRFFFALFVGGLSASLMLTSLFELADPSFFSSPTNAVQPTEQASEEHECRFWGMIADLLPEDVVFDHLISLPYSLKNLGEINRDGWGLAYYDGMEPVVHRGLLPAKSDPTFDQNVMGIAQARARIGVCHVRMAASGASGIPNPHPFIRYAGGSWWAFGHNGVLSKTALTNLIGEDFLKEYSPTVGDNWSDPRVVDSDLYMLYILKCIEEKDWNANEGIAQAVRDISRVDFGAMNFFLTDGEILWGFRKGNTLYYCYNETARYSAIASQPPTSTQEGWIALGDYSLVTLTENGPPSIVEDVTTVPEASSAFFLPLFVAATLLMVAIPMRRKARTHARRARISALLFPISCQHRL